MVLTLFFSISSCDNEGVVGGGFTDGEERVEITTYVVDDISVVSDDGFSGQLPYSGTGIVNDPVYGTITSSSLLKPSITQNEIEDFSDAYSLNLVLQFNPRSYGDTTSTSQYNIYEINERWRGREILYNNPVEIDESTLIGSFQVTDEDSVTVPISTSYTERFREFFNDTTARRDSLYRFEFPGIAIVPDEQNSKIDFLRHQGAIDDTSSSAITRFTVENAEDSVVATLPVLDHGNSMSRTNIPVNTDGFVLHNTMEHILKVNFDFGPEQFEGKEIVNAQLIFNVDTEPQNNPVQDNFTRLDNNFLRGHTFDTEPLSLHSVIFTQQATVGATLDDEDDVYRITVTQYIINQIYGETDSNPLYITNQGNNGLYVSTKLMGPSAAENLRPRLIVTTINPDN